MNIEMSNNAEASVEPLIRAVKKEGSILGPVYYRLFSKYAVEYAAHKIGEECPAIEDLEGAKAYLIGACKKNLECRNALGIAMARAESAIQGAVGPISRRIIRATVEDILTMMGLIEKAGTVTAYEAANEFLGFLQMVEFFGSGNYTLTNGNENELTFDLNNCPISGACSELRAMGIKRVVGEECRVQSMIALTVELMLKKPVDFTVTKKEIPNCGGKITVK